MPAPCWTGRSTHQRQQWADYVKVAEEKIRAAGNVITVINDNSAWQAAMQPMYDALSADLQAVVKEIRAVK